MQSLNIANSQFIAVSNVAVVNGVQVSNSSDVSIRNSTIGSAPGEPSLAIDKSSRVVVQQVTLDDYVRINDSHSIVLDTVQVMHSTGSAALVVSNSDQIVARNFMGTMVLANSTNVQVFGTDANDTLNLSLSNVANLSVDTGSGHDTLLMRGTVGALVVHSGTGPSDALILQEGSNILSPGG